MSEEFVPDRDLALEAIKKIQHFTADENSGWLDECSYLDVFGVKLWGSNFMKEMIEISYLIDKFSGEAVLMFENMEIKAPEDKVEFEIEYKILKLSETFYYSFEDYSIIDMYHDQLMEFIDYCYDYWQDDFTMIDELDLIGKRLAELENKSNNVINFKDWIDKRNLN